MSGQVSFLVVIGGHWLSQLAKVGDAVDGLADVVRAIHADEQGLLCFKMLVQGL